MRRRPYYSSPLEKTRHSETFYIDIGANDAVIYSDTYFFYRAGARGILSNRIPLFAKKSESKDQKISCLK